MSLLLCLSLFAGLLSDWSLTASPAFAAALGHPQNTLGALTFQQYLKQGRRDTVSHAPVHPIFGPAPHSPAPDGPTVALPSSTQAPTMKPLTVILSTAFLSNGPGAKGVDLKSSDGRLEVQLVPGTFDLSHATVASGTPTRKTHTTRSAPPSPTAPTVPATPGTTKGKATPTARVTPKASPKTTPTVSATAVPATPTPTPSPGPSPTPPASPTVTGALTLTITEQHGFFVGENVSLGSYQFRFTDAHGHAVSGVTVHQPLIILYHYQPSVMRQFDLDPG